MKWLITPSVKLLLGLSFINLVLIGLLSWQITILFNRVSTQILTDTTFTSQQILSTFSRALNGVESAPNNYTWLLLGLDATTTRQSAPLTDSIAVVNVDTASGQVSIISLPRDLWLPEYQTKINALYTYGLERDPDNPTQLLETAVTELTDLKFDGSIVLSLEAVTSLVSAVDKIQLFVPQGFIDEEYPRPGFENDPVLANRYQTIEFTTGWQLLDAEKAEQYIRSRKSNTLNGTDIARTNRQQQVLEALLDKITSPEFLLKPTNINKVLIWYQTYIEAQMPLELVATIFWQLIPALDEIAIYSATLPTEFNSTNPILLNPEPSPEYLNQWVFIESQPGVIAEYLQQQFGS